MAIAVVEQFWFTLYFLFSRLHEYAQLFEDNQVFSARAGFVCLRIGTTTLARLIANVEWPVLEHCVSTSKKKQESEVVMHQSFVSSDWASAELKKL